jgi:Carboxypeptidase regulatory-like domain
MGFVFRAQRCLVVASMVAGVTATAGCSSSSSGGAPVQDAAPDTSTIDTGVADAPSTEPEAGEAAGPVVSVTWQILAQVPSLGMGMVDAAAEPPISGVKVCVYQMASIPCATTDDSGSFTLTGVPAIGNFVLVAEKDGYRSIAAPITTAGLNLNGLQSPLKMPVATGFVPAIDGGIDWTNKAQIQLFALGPSAILPDGGPPGVPGATVTLSPMSGVGPLFLTDQNTFDFAATTLVDVAGAVYDVEPGTYTLTFDAQYNDCEAISVPLVGFGYSAGPHEITFPVIAGYTTGVGVYCATTTGTSVSDGGSGGEAGAPADGGGD